MKTNLPLITFAGLLVLAGCAHQGTDEQGFVTTTFRDGATFGLKSENALQGYQDLYLKSVTALPSANQHAHDPAELAALEYAFEGAFRDCVGHALPVTNAPGPKTLLVEAKISEIKNTMSNSAAGTVPSSMTDLAPITDSTLIVGGLRLKVTFYDSESGEQLAYFEDNEFGSDIESSQPGKTSWANVHAAMNQWCGDMKTELEQATQ